jgi:apolipoprotein N-acyltransferase
LSGILLLLSYPPFNFGYILAWIALVPLLIAVHNEKNMRRIGRLTSITGLCIAPLFVFMYNEFDYFLPTTIAWILGIMAAVAIGNFIIWYVKDYWKPHNLPREKLQYLPSPLQILIIPILGTAAEFLAMNLPVVMKVGGALGFFSLSRTQWLNTPILQLTSITGMYGITFLVLLVNSAIAYLLINYKETKSISKQVVVMVLIFGVIFTWGWGLIPEYTEGDVTVVIIQAKPQVMEKEHINELYLNLTECSLKYEPEIILWPPWVAYEPVENVGPFAAGHSEFAEENNLYLIDVQNVVYPDGLIEHYDTLYHFRNIFDGLHPIDFNKIFPEIHSFGTRFGKLGILLCMESASTIPAKKLVEDGAQFIVVTSADRPVIGSFQGLIGGNVVYRAVEHRMYTALFYGFGDSIIVDPYGRIIEDVASEQEIVAGKISFTDERTFYSSHGDLFGYTILGLVIMLITCNFFLERKSDFKYCLNCRAKIKKDVEICDRCGKKQEKRPLWKRILLHEYYEHIKK